MKYEFHVGDYVETAEGDVGYVAMVDMGTGDVSMDIKLTKDGANVYRCQAFTLDSAPHLFNRIGQYDFTKPDKEDGIKLLIKSWVLDDADSTNEYYFDSREVIRKINEMVDAINELRGEKKE